MNLKIQVLSLVFSFFYGIVFSLLVNVNYRFLFAKKKIIKIIFTFIFVIDMALIYFLILKFLNDGIIHIYFLFMILLGFYITFPVGSKFRKWRLFKRRK